MAADGTCHRIINGEQKDAPEVAAAVWKAKQLKRVIHQYRDEDVCYNADETAVL
jgi:hypothetical protein